MPLLKQLFKPTNRDLLKRIGFTLIALAIFIIGTTIQVPGTDSITSNLGFLELVNTMGGGALQNFSIFALGVMPYITATIVMQLLGELIPYFQELNKQGHVGRQKIILHIVAPNANVLAFLTGKENLFHIGRIDGRIVTRPTSDLATNVTF